MDCENELSPSLYVYLSTLHVDRGCLNKVKHFEQPKLSNREEDDEEPKDVELS